jgi:hypothetical protein
MVKTNNGTMMEGLIKKFREVHEKEHKIWFTIEEIVKIIEEYDKKLEKK